MSFFAPGCVPMSFSALGCVRMSFSAPMSFFAPACHLLLQCLFLFHLQNKNPTSVDDNSSSGDFPLAKVGCSREEVLIFRFDTTDPELADRLFLRPAVCAARRFRPRFESPESAAKVGKSQYFVSLKGAHTKHMHVPTSRQPINTYRHAPVLRSRYL